MRILKNVKMLVLDKREKVLEDEIEDYDYVVRKRGKDSLKVIKDRTKILSEEE